jgi:H+/gluconate symporter-like permease
MDIINQIHGGSFIIAVILTSIVWYIAFKIYKWLLQREMKENMHSSLPVSMEEIEHSRNLERAVQDVELRRRDLKISEQKLAVAEANAKVESSLTRIGQLNQELEVIKVDKGAKKLIKDKYAEVGSEVKN